MKRAALFLTLASFVLLPRAAMAVDVGVSVYNNSFAPTPVQATTGEKVTWTWTCTDGSYGGGTNCISHNVTAFEGASFASGNKSAQGSTFSYTPTSNASIKYRCTLHSSLSGATCNGMCGAIVPDNEKPTVRIFRPASPLVTLGTPGARVNFAGDVKDNREVVAMWFRVTSLLGTGGGTFAMACPNCPMSGQNLWESDLDLAPGHYTVTANARDSSGLEGASPAITVVVI